MFCVLLSPLCKKKFSKQSNSKYLFSNSLNENFKNNSQNLDHVDSNDYTSENFFMMNFQNEFSHESNAPYYLDLVAEGISLKFEIDTGTSLAIISKKIYEKYFQNKTLYPNDLKLKTWFGQVNFPIGICKLHITYKEKQCMLDTYIVNGEDPPLIGRKELEKLGK